MTTTRAGEPDRSEHGAERMQFTAHVLAKALQEALQERDQARAEVEDLVDENADLRRQLAMAREDR